MGYRDGNDLFAVRFRPAFRIACIYIYLFIYLSRGLKLLHNVKYNNYIIKTPERTICAMFWHVYVAIRYFFPRTGTEFFGSTNRSLFVPLSLYFIIP